MFGPFPKLLYIAKIPHNTMSQLSVHCHKNRSKPETRTRFKNMTWLPLMQQLCFTSFQSKTRGKVKVYLYLVNCLYHYLLMDDHVNAGRSVIKKKYLNITIKYELSKI